MVEDFRLKVFETLVRIGSFTAAARELGISQPAVSQNISELEKSLGEKLFNRERGAVSLTDKGKLFKGYADQILHWYRAADAAFNGPSVFESGRDIPKPLELPLGEGRNARIWASLGDIHISLD
ncbi:MAG: LysR family transcriptional regulator [Bacteroidales bacterium]|nr:LysR family transcriptional regulator [Bacteroidales bacterium]